MNSEKETCHLCNGKGTIKCGMEYGDDDVHPSDCPVCGGNINEDFLCPECDGSGFSD